MFLERQEGGRGFAISSGMNDCFLWANACARIVFESQTQDLSSKKHLLHRFFPNGSPWKIFSSAVFAVQENFLEIAHPLPLKNTNGPSLMSIQKAHWWQALRDRSALLVNSLYKPVTTGASRRIFAMHLR